MKHNTQSTALPHSCPTSSGGYSGLPTGQHSPFQGYEEVREGLPMPADGHEPWEV